MVAGLQSHELIPAHPFYPLREIGIASLTESVTVSNCSIHIKPATYAGAYLGDFIVTQHAVEYRLYREDLLRSQDPGTCSGDRNISVRESKILRLAADLGLFAPLPSLSCQLTLREPVVAAVNATLSRTAR